MRHADVTHAQDLVEIAGLAAKAARLAAQMNGWLAGPADDDPTQAKYVGSDLVEWCRSARDILEALSSG